MTEQQKVIIKNYLDSSIDDIENTLGRLIVSDKDIEPSGIDIDNFKEIAQNYMAKQIPNFQRKLCNNSELIKQVNNNMPGIEIVATIADILTPFIGGIPVFVLATLIYKRGLDKLCNTIIKI